jgi:hypothetical protein
MSKPWLQSQLEEAKNDVERWPDWMKKIAWFDGINRKRPERTQSSDKGSSANPKREPRATPRR